ncbi:hypothetical protein E2C01_046694 [Portunus trituberculatus]|uniref:Uncharacterized protein n=1 Tax=Portunus trituberculatus TaxID=210409 RepID=A0A5B7G5S4_PORTR|nr:hypothetical protein [Portunus trituberculatus]
MVISKKKATPSNARKTSIRPTPSFSQPSRRTLTSAARIWCNVQGADDTKGWLFAYLSGSEVAVNISDSSSHGIGWKEQEDPVKELCNMLQLKVRDSENGDSNDGGHAWGKGTRYKCL